MKIKTLDFFKVAEGVRVPYFGGLLYRVISKRQMKEISRIDVSSLSLNTEDREEKIIVSITSFPARIECVGYAIKSLFNQSLKPDRIVLWLASSQFENVELPKLLIDLQERGLEICYCEDLRSHKKYHYSLKNQKPNELVITYDDDLIYPEDSIKMLYLKHIKYPNCIVCNRAQTAVFDGDKFAKYNTWKVHSSVGVKTPSSKLFPSTGGGTLYPYDSVDEEVFNVEVMKETSYSADDLWVRFMSAKKGTKIIKTRKNHKPFSTIDKSQVVGLQQENCLGDGNDKALTMLSEQYPEVVEEILKKD